MGLKRERAGECDDLFAPRPLEDIDPSSTGDGAIVVNDDGIPEWVDRRFPILFIILGLIAAVAVGASPADQPAAFGVALVLMAISPWALSLIGIRVPDPLFVAMVLAPVGFLIIAGEPLELVDLDGGAPQLTMMLVVGIVGQIAAVGSVRFVTATTAVAVVIVLAGAIVRGSPLDFAPWWVGILLALGGGRAFRSSIIRLAELRVAQQALADQYLAEERRRIAREVHDIVAHTMSVTMLHITAARLAIQRDPTAATGALEEAERTGRASLDDIRGIVRLLRTDESPVDTAIPADTDITALVDRYRAAGSPITVEGYIDMNELPADTRLATYRIVQESVANAVRHGTGQITVRVHAEDRHLTIAIENAADRDRAVRQGAGLTGMRERAEALGGSFHAGLEPTGRWSVCAKIPT